jgi:hypothetical protein
MIRLPGHLVRIRADIPSLRAILVSVGLCAALAAVPTVGSASIGLGAVVSANPANITPNVASGAVYKLLQVGGTIYAGGTFGSVSTPAGVSPGGTFTSVNGVARRGVAKLHPTTGAVDTAFNAKLTSGKVTELALTGGRLIAGGTFPGKLRAVNPATGANTGYLNLGIGGSVASNADPADLDQLHRRRHPALGGRHRRGRVRPGPPALAEQPPGVRHRRAGRGQPPRHRRHPPDHRAGPALEPDQGARGRRRDPPPHRPAAGPVA